MLCNNFDAASGSCGEIIPGLWIGSIASLPHLLRNNDKNVAMKKSRTSSSSCEDWLVISLLDSDRLLRLTKAMVAAAASTNNDNAMIHHVVWKLPDKSSAPFLSDELESIIDQISTHLVHNDDNNEATWKARSTASSHRRKYCLVHCAQGKSRSAALCAAWLLMTQPHQIASSLADALSYIRRVRPLIQPNLGLVAALRALEQLPKHDRTVSSARRRWKEARGGDDVKDKEKEENLDIPRGT